MKKKIFGFLITLITAAAAFMLCAVSASAAGNSFASASKITSGKTYTVSLPKAGESVAYYKFTTVKAGEMTLDVDINDIGADVYIYNSEKSLFRLQSFVNMMSGESGGRSGGIRFTGNNSFLPSANTVTPAFSPAGKMTCFLEKGTYYLKLSVEDFDFDKGTKNTVKFTPTFASSSSSPVFMSAETIQSGTEYKTEPLGGIRDSLGDDSTFLAGERLSYADYKINAASSGELKLKFDARVNMLEIRVFDSNGKALSYSAADPMPENEAMYGGFPGADKTYAQFISSKSGNQSRVTGTVTYKVNKGTYYIRLAKTDTRLDADETVNFTATFPSDSASGKISCLTITVKKGSSVQLGTDMSGKVTWSSSKKSVAEVSSTGKVTAKSKGTAYITAKSGSGSVKIKVEVN